MPGGERELAVSAAPRNRRNTFARETVKVPRLEKGAGPTRSAALVVLQGAESDIGNYVWIEGTVTLGRDPQIELPLDDEMISRRHCRVVTDGPRYFVEDLQSTNGTRLNEAPLDGRAELKAGDTIRLGEIVVKFTFAEEAELSYHAAMNERVGTDELTGLVARRRFDAALERALEAAKRMKTPLALMALDVDGLKLINDAHGHPMGGYTIAAVGKIIGEVVTPHGAACRVGGDEFVAFLRNLTKPVAVEFGESIRGWVHKHRFEMDGVIVKPTISIGVAAFPGDGRTTDRLLKRADEALYRAKKEGRDRVCG
jgi:diguanylate cyclase (GGDEF)-like protein